MNTRTPLMQYFLECRKTGVCVSLQNILCLSSEVAIGLEHISEQLANTDNERYHCNLCDTTSSASGMYQHITSSSHQRRYLLQKNIISLEQDTSTQEVRAFAEEYERKYGRHIEQIKVFKTKLEEQEFRNSQNSNVSNTQCKNVSRRKRPLKSTDSIDRTHLRMLVKSLLQNVHDTSVESRRTRSDSIIESFREGCLTSGRATTSNNARTINEEIREYSGTTICLDNSDDEDSVTTISSSTTSVVSLSDMEEEKSDQMINYNFNNSYDVATRTEKQNDSVGSANGNRNPTKMKCLQVFMEKSEPLIIETQSQYTFVVSVIQTVSEAVEKCNLQNIPP